jgi:hypothetical protein
MREFQVIALVICSLVGCATRVILPDSLETRDRLLSDAQRRSAEYCAKAKGKCEYTVVHSASGDWHVSVVPTFVGLNGSAMVAFGTDLFFYYNRYGQFSGSDAGF